MQATLLFKGLTKEVRSALGGDPLAEVSLGMGTEWDRWRENGAIVKPHEPSFRLPALLQIGAPSAVCIFHLSSICQDISRIESVGDREWWNVAGRVFSLEGGREFADILSSDRVMLVGADVGPVDIRLLMRGYGVEMTASRFTCVRKLASRKLGESHVRLNSLGRLRKDLLGGQLRGKGYLAGIRRSIWSRRSLSEEQLQHAANDAACSLAAHEKLIEMADAPRRAGGSETL